MDTIRKRPVPPHEQCDTTQETKLGAQRDHPAPPRDLLFPLDASVPHASANRAAEGAPDPLPTYPPLFRRIRPRPRRIAAPTSVGTPDWKLSTGAAVVLLGFAIAFGTYITLTQRDAMQSRLRRIVTQNELRAMPRHDRPTIADRTQELARTLRDQIEALRSRDATDTAVMAGAAAHQSANAHSSTLASSTPSLPVKTAPVSPPASPAKTPGKTPAKQTKQLAARQRRSHARSQHDGCTTGTPNQHEAGECRVRHAFYLCASERAKSAQAGEGRQQDAAGKGHHDHRRGATHPSQNSLKARAAHASSHRSGLVSTRESRHIARERRLASLSAALAFPSAVIRPSREKPLPGGKKRSDVA